VAEEEAGYNSAAVAAKMNLVGEEASAFFMDVEWWRISKERRWKI
jgi:hypothetical protein